MEENESTNEEQQQQFGELVLILGDFHIPSRAIDIPDKFKQILLPDKVHNVICTGNIGSRPVREWLKGLSNNFVLIKGDYDVVPGTPEHQVFTVGKVKIGVIHGHQIVPWGDRNALANVARKLDCDLLVNGFTHQLNLDKCDEKYLVNPGSATGAYSSFTKENYPSFIILEILGSNINAYTYEYKDGKVSVSNQHLSNL